MANRDCRVYVGNLPPDVRASEVEDLFAKYGKITYVDLKNGRKPPFAFVDFEDIRDAEDAVKHRDGYDYDGYRLRVEFIRGVGPRGPGGRPMGGGGEGDDRRYRGGGGGGGGGGRGGGYSNGAPPAYRQGGGGGMAARGGSGKGGFRVEVTGLPTSGSWQDLKDHMRAAGDVCYSDVFRDGTGVVEYERADDMKYALRKLDDTKFRSHEGDTTYIRVREATGGGGRDRSRSPIGGRRGSPSYSPRRSTNGRASRSRSRS